LAAGADVANYLEDSAVALLSLIYGDEVDELSEFSPITRLAARTDMTDFSGMYQESAGYSD
jgi:hypothetical protein